MNKPVIILVTSSGFMSRYEMMPNKSLKAVFKRLSAAMQFAVASGFYLL
ncbi:MAG: hypothetical protein JWR72_3277 [Flavisolibacter sp.]|jgi:hypothetical protein|nr:hypothetical protein [Flavisolibacter sp.]